MHQSLHALDGIYMIKTAIVEKKIPLTLNKPI